MKPVPERKRHPHAMDPKITARMKPMFDAGMSMTKIGRKLGVAQTTVARVAKREGWYVRRQREFKWKVKNRFPPNTITTYRKYCHSIRHLTNKMYEQYKSVIDPLEQKGEYYHVDHMLSIHEAYTAGDVPLPWQMVCHPANLVLLERDENRTKGAQSSLTPSKLKNRIARFELEHGIVRMPVIVGEKSDGRIIYNQTMHETIQQRIQKDSRVTLRQARQIILEGRKCPPLEFRQQLRREHYEYIVFAYSKGHTNRKMAYKLGCTVDALRRVLARLGLTRIGHSTPAKISLVVRLAKKGRTVKFVAEKLGITPLEALCLYEMKTQ